MAEKESGSSTARHSDAPSAANPADAVLDPPNAAAPKGTKVLTAADALPEPEQPLEGDKTERDQARELARQEAMTDAVYDRTHGKDGKPIPIVDETTEEPEWTPPKATRATKGDKG